MATTAEPAKVIVKRKVGSGVQQEAGNEKKRKSKQLAITSLFAPKTLSDQCTCGLDEAAKVEDEETSSDDLLWTERFRPGGRSSTSKMSLIGNEEQWSTVRQWFQRRAAAKKSSGPSRSLLQPTCLLIVGPPGVGKTSAVQAMASELELPLTEFNMSLQRDVETITHSMVGLLITEAPHVVCLEEIDGMSSPCAKALENVLRHVCTPNDCDGEDEKRASAWSELNLLVATANHLTPILAKMASYFLVVNVGRLAAFQMRELAERVLLQCRVGLSEATIQQCIRDAKGDARSMLNKLQLLGQGGQPSPCPIHHSPIQSDVIADQKMEEVVDNSLSLERTIQSLLSPSTTTLWSLDKCQDLASTVPDIGDWCFHNYLPLWKKQRSNRKTVKQWVPHTEDVLDILSDMDVVGSAEFGRGSNGTREIGRSIGAFRLHSIFSSSSITKHQHKQSLPLGVVGSAPPSHKISLWSSRPDLDKCKTNSSGLATENQAVSRAKVIKRYPGRLDILALLDPLHTPLHCMWCQAGFPHDSVFARDLQRFRKPWHLGKNTLPLKRQVVCEY